ncbi:hypothetical protein MRB53_012605 [Persea americana]|uniref:Uncharacterized protein n=1 Tax=Persea americana TaxID=3435 RepID=A0ACC2LYQ0_PERAE|nr:hypothetical protein MRB53_012605 [Persea americana]
MGGGNGQKAKMARERNLEKQKGAKGSQLESNKKAMTIQCKVCMQTFICTTSEVKLLPASQEIICEHKEKVYVLGSVYELKLGVSLISWQVYFSTLWSLFWSCVLQMCLHKFLHTTIDV